MAKRSHNVRYVKFSAEEMAYEPPAEVDLSKGFNIRGIENYRRFRQWKKQVALLEPDVRAAFPDDGAINKALRKVIELQNLRPTGNRRRRKSA